MNKRFYSITTEKEADIYINSTIKTGKVAEAGSIASDKYAYSANLGTHINSSATTIGTLEVPLGYYKQGDSIKLGADFYSISGVKPKLMLQFSATAGSGIGGAVVTYQADLAGEVQSLEYTHTVGTDGFYRAVYGVITADVGEFYIRVPYADIHSVTSVTKLDTLAYKKVVKQFTFTFGSGVPAMQNLYSYDSATITVDGTDLTKMKMTFTEPFTDTAKRVVVTQSFQSFLDSYKYVLKFENTLYNEITMFIYDLATNAKVAPTTMPVGIYFQLAVHGYDLN